MADLMVAYGQNSPAREDDGTIRRDLYLGLPNARLREKLAELEAVENQDAETRTERLEILSTLQARE